MILQSYIGWISPFKRTCAYGSSTCCWTVLDCAGRARFISPAPDERTLDRVVLLNDITESDYGIISQNFTTGLYHGYIYIYILQSTLRKLITELYYGIRVQNYTMKRCYGNILMKQILEMPGEPWGSVGPPGIPWARLGPWGRP